MTIALKLEEFYHKVLERESVLASSDGNQRVLSLISKLDPLIAMTRMYESPNHLSTVFRQLLIFKSELLAMIDQHGSNEVLIDSFKEFIKSEIVTLLEISQSYDNFGTDFNKMFDEQNKKSLSRYDWAINNFELNVKQSLDKVNTHLDTAEKIYDELMHGFFNIEQLMNELATVDKTVEKTLWKAFKTFKETHSLCIDSYETKMTFMPITDVLTFEATMTSDLANSIEELLLKKSLFGRFNKQKNLQLFREEFKKYVDTQMTDFRSMLHQAHEAYFTSFNRQFMSEFESCFVKEYCKNKDLKVLIKALDGLLYSFNVKERKYSLIEIIKYG
jgi:hypothetical protein